MNDYERVRDRSDKRPRRMELLANLHLNGTIYPSCERGGEEKERIRIMIPRAIRYRQRQREKRCR